MSESSVRCFQIFIGCCSKGRGAMGGRNRQFQPRRPKFEGNQKFLWEPKVNLRRIDGSLGSTRPFCPSPHLPYPPPFPTLTNAAIRYKNRKEHHYYFKYEYLLRLLVWKIFEKYESMPIFFQWKPLHPRI